VAVQIDGLRGERYVVDTDRSILDRATAEVEAEGRDGGTAAGARVGRPAGRDPGVAFVAPLDPLVWDRALLGPLFDFEYVWEVYVPAARRRWGYYVLPILYGDALVGRIEPRLERRAGVLRVDGLWWEAGFDPLADPRFVPAFAAALDALRAFGDARRFSLPRVVRHRPFVVAVRAVLAGTIADERAAG
jgi:uncharacterized protein YcaQ